MRLTAVQLQRLCGVDPRTCHAVLDVLVAARFLKRTSDGCYTRATDGGVAHAD